jgi:hypothetical protein
MFYCRCFSTLEYETRRVQVNRDDLQLNGTHERLVYFDNDMLGGSVHTIKRNTQSSVFDSKKIELEVNAEKLNTWSGLEIRI